MPYKVKEQLHNIGSGIFGKDYGGHGFDLHRLHNFT
jgi:hypothetical protein